MLGPRIATLPGFSAQQVAGDPALPPLECRLLLTEALRRYRNLFPGQPNAEVAEALFELFEELTAEHVDPGADEAEFSARLQRAYGRPPLEWLSREAQIVFKLWRAFQEQVAGRSPAAVHLRNLRAGFAAATAAAPLHLVGFDAFSRGELELVRAALRDGRAELWLHGRDTGHDGAALRALLPALDVAVERRVAPPSRLGPLLDAAFAETVQEIPHSARDDTKPRDGAGIRVVEAGSAEHEARCVDLAVRQALLAGARDVVVLTQDRRLARRLRALLERAQVPLQDPTGWALSTSRAAAALDAWLECLEGRFRFRPLLDLLKSGFAEVDPAALERLERKLVYRDGIDGGLPAFIAAAESKPLEALLKKLKAAAFAIRGDEPRPAQAWIDALVRSIERIGLRERLQGDAAGAQLARVLAQLRGAFARVPLALRWEEFRALLDGTVERSTFIPDPSRGPVRLLTLDQAVPLRCERLILAGATREQLPGAPAREPFFSQSVRVELGLPDWRMRQDLALARLRAALDGADTVLVTYSAGNDEDPAQASPWIEAIEAQAARASLDLRDREFAWLAASAAAEIGDAAAGTAPPTTRPAPATPVALLPERLSATAHQALLDCPYRFFARSVLKLETEHAPDEDPDRSDYGDRVHRILQAFTERVEGLPAPFTERITHATLARAQVQLEEIAAAVFAPELERRALALTWKAEFQASIPELLDWFVARPPLREVHAEVELVQELAGTRLYGKVDRLETRADGQRNVIDYKTGRLPRADAIEQGEAVQLLHYALLDPAVAAVEYRPLRKDEDPLVLEPELPALRDAARARLRAALERLHAGAPLPAQGDATVCGYCEFQGVCRREDWHG